MSAVLLSQADRKAGELLRAIRAHFAAEQVDVVLALIPLAPNAGRHARRLPSAAYHNGLVVGLSYDSRDEKYPECPYDARQLPNFLKGANDPREAWRDGSRDAIRIRDIVLRPERRPYPILLHREFKVLTPELQAAHAAFEGA